MVSGDNATSVAFLPKTCVLLLKVFTLFTYMSVNLSVNTCTHVFWYVCLCMNRGQKRAVDPSEVGTGVCRMLGSELQSHNYSAKILNCWATSPVTHLILFLKTQAALQLTIFLPDSSKCWDDRTVLPCPSPQDLIPVMSRHWTHRDIL